MVSGSGAGSTQWFKRAQRGLYDGKQRLTGNHVSASKRHMPRAWLPNVHEHALWSDILQRRIHVKVVASALRHIDRVGGIDNYLLHTQESQLASEKAQELKTLLQRTLKKQAEQAQREARMASRATATAAPAAELQ